MSDSQKSSDSKYNSDAQLLPKFSNYRSRLMLGTMPDDFLRLQHLQIADASHQINIASDFLGYFTLIVSEARLIKNAGPLGLLRMDPYVRFQIGEIMHDTPTAVGGGKNPQWNTLYRINLFRGMETIHLEIYDQRNFTEDSFIGECDAQIPVDVFNGKTCQLWYSLKGRDGNADENQGDILLIMSLTVTLPENVVVLDDPNFGFEVEPSSSISSVSSRSNSVNEQIPLYSADDVRTIEEMFPTVDRQIIVNLLDKHGGSKDLAVNELLQNNT